MVPTTPILVLILLTLLSMRYWFMLFKAKSMAPLFPFNTNRCQLEPSLPVLFAILWISLSLYSSIENTWKQWHSPTVSPNAISLSIVITSSSIKLSFGTVLFFLLTISNYGSMQKLGFHINDRFEQIRDGFLGFLLSLIPVVSLLLLTNPIRSEETLHPLFLLLKEQPHFSTIAWIFFSAVVVAPLVEELVYRVVLLSWLEDLLGPFKAILVSSLIFSVVHGFPDCIPLFPLAFILGTLFYYRRSYLTVVIVHALFNSTFLAIALAEQQ